MPQWRQDKDYRIRRLRRCQPVPMGSDSKWRRMMYIAVRPAEMIKAEWDMAYKHVSGCWADHNLQVIEFLR